MKPSKGFIVVISIIVIGILAFLVWQGYLWHVNRIYNQVTLLYEVSWTGFSANCLKTLDNQETDKTRRLLEMALDSSIRNAYELVEGGFKLEGSLPNMKKGVELAGQYAKSKQLDPEVIKQAEKIFNEGFE